jgi:hypothetical protein
VRLIEILLETLNRKEHDAVREKDEGAKISAVQSGNGETIGDTVVTQNEGARSDRSAIVVRY